MVETACAARLVGQRTKLLPLAGYFPNYNRYYGGRSGSHTGRGKSDPFWDV